MTMLRSAPPAVAAPDAAPPAARVQRPGWRDPRLVLGVVIVAVCVLLGARVLADADDTVAVWSLRHDVPAGAGIHRGDLAAVRVHLVGGTADRYLVAGTGPRPGLRAGHDLAAGELLPRSALEPAGGADLVEVPLSVAADDLPASVRPGAVVDVWVTPTAPATDQDRTRARLALDDVVVVAVPSSADSLAPRTTRQVIVGVPQAQAGDLAEALGLLADGRVVLTRRLTS